MVKSLCRHFVGYGAQLTIDLPPVWSTIFQHVNANLKIDSYICIVSDYL